MADISKIKIENDTYDIKDTTARSSIATINNTLDLKFNKKYLLVGDSYGEGYTPDGYVESWCTKFKNLAGLNNSNCTILVAGGYGFGITNNFATLIQTATADDELTDIILLAGYNDITAGSSNIKTGMQNFKTNCASKFPNATIKIGFVGWSNDPAKLVNLRFACNYYIQACKELNIEYLNNMDYCLHEYFSSFSSDGFHPNVHGEERIATSLINALNTGDANISFNYENFNMGMNYAFTTPTTITSAFTTNMINNLVYFCLKMQFRLNCSNATIVCDNTKYDVGDITAGHLIGNSYNMINIPVNAVVHTNGDYIPTKCVITIENKKMRISFYNVTDDLHNWRTYTNVTDIQIQPFSALIDGSVN